MRFHTFPKKEHLKSRKHIQALFHSGKAFSVFPFKVCYQIVGRSPKPAVRVGFSVPLRNFKKATDRNRIKRQMREVYRLGKADLADFVLEQHLQVNVFFIYLGRQMPDYAFLSRKMGVSLKQLGQALEQAGEKDENDQ